MRKILAILLSATMVSGFALTASASGQSEMVITHPEKGVTEGSVEEKCMIIDGVYYPTHGTRAAFEDYVGIGNDDKGPWLHGVTPDGIVYSYYKNPKYWHGSSARGSAGLDRSELVPKDVMSYASIQTIWLDGNHAYWRVDENKQ